MGVNSDLHSHPAKMNPQQAQDQVKHMREFIIHEANEKADELNAKAEQDYTVEKQRLVEDAKQQIRKEMDRREQNVELETKIANATETNKNKLKVLAAASGQIEQTFDAAYTALQDVAKGGAYGELLKALIAEAVTLLDGKSGKVRCRAEDKSLVQGALSAGGDFKLTLDPEPLSVDSSVSNIKQECLGGVLVTSEDGKIVVNQTLNSRLQTAYDTALPCIKPALFNTGGSKHTA